MAKRNNNGKTEEFSNQREDILRNEFKQELNNLRDEIGKKFSNRWAICILTIVFICLGSLLSGGLQQIFSIRGKMAEVDKCAACLQTKLEDMASKK